VACGRVKNLYGATKNQAKENKGRLEAKKRRSRRKGKGDKGKKKGK
jgi:hypothetical protein